MNQTIVTRVIVVKTLLTKNKSCNNEHIQEGCKKCPMCNLFTKFKGDLIKHLLERHDVSAFRISETDFTLWKNEIEKQNNCSFIKEYMKSQKVAYICNRSGYYILQTENRTRTLKTQGTNKINAYYPAGIPVQIELSGRYIVNYIKTHVVHKCDLGHLFLTTPDRKLLAGNSLQKIPFHVTLDEIRDSIKKTVLTRVYFVTKKDLYNTGRCFNRQTQ
ncbi:hypothetical protein NQ314_011357 [Rhamnusium bicolor]|uniref:Uncharacterized protein n=1 Tax=Rhamnusium bicolor TaxID=1586634 RepID=A0AAV8XJD9_9CUCU|nr:hypothetical protein NQ314_011357 [Rhamnusium bicolor]